MGLLNNDNTIKAGREEGVDVFCKTPGVKGNG